MTKLLVPVVLVTVLATGCAGLQARAGSASFNAGIPVAVSGAADAAGGVADGALVAEDTGDELIAVGFRLNTPAVIAAGFRALRNLMPEAMAVLLGAPQPQPAEPTAL